MPKPAPIRPMEARHAGELPTGPDWIYEPKYDGFRCIADRDSAGVRLWSKSGKLLDRFFPEIVDGIAALEPIRFTIDGELQLRRGGFGSLMMRMHPAASRARRLAIEMPARLIAFDILRLEDDGLAREPFAVRRQALEAFVLRNRKSPILKLGKQTANARTARGWLGKDGLDGIMAKQLDLTYRPGERALVKFKPDRTLDCVVGGVAFRKGTRIAEQLLLGLYDDEGKLQFVGQAAAGEHGAEMGELLAPLEGGSGFSGRSPNGKDRWTGADRDVVFLDPRIVAEVGTKHVAGGFLRHGAQLLRFRPDKAPGQCRFDQIA